MTGAAPGGRSLAPYFPVPLVGAAALLAVLILLTPNLLSTGSPSAGSLESQAELVLDRAPSGTDGTHLYLRGLGLVRFASLALAVLPFNGSTPPAAPPPLDRASADRATGVLELDNETTASSFLVNASAEFVDSAGATVTYQGAWAFVWTTPTALRAYPYGAATGAGTTDAAALPLALLLPQLPSGGTS